MIKKLVMRNYTCVSSKFSLKIKHNLSFSFNIRYCLFCDMRCLLNMALFFDLYSRWVFIYFIPTLEWLYRKCSCKKIKLFLNTVSWWFRDNCKYMLWIFLKFNVLMTCIGDKRKHQKLFTGLGTICIPL